MSSRLYLFLGERGLLSIRLYELDTTLWYHRRQLEQIGYPSFEQWKNGRFKMYS